jgi:uncharacterized coiled-coil protein SlyX
MTELERRLAELEEKVLAQDDRAAGIRHQLAANNLSLEVTREVLSERIDSVRALVETLANRPQPGVPIWVILALAIPNGVLALSTLVLVLYLVFVRSL